MSEFVMNWELRVNRAIRVELTRDHSRIPEIPNFTARISIGNFSKVITAQGDAQLIGRIRQILKQNHAKIAEEVLFDVPKGLVIPSG